MPGIFKPLSSPSEEMQQLDLLRFIASLAIVVYHFQFQMSPTPAVQTWLSIRGQLNVAVDLFFLISGFVISRFYSGIHGKDEYFSFMWKRFARLYPLHLLTLVIFIAIGLAGDYKGIQFHYPEQFDYACIPANILLIQSLHTCNYLTFNVVSWSISAELLLYLCFPLFIWLRRKSAVAIAFVLMGYIALYFAAPDGSPSPWHGWTYDFGVLRAAPSFLLGGLCYDYRHAISRIPGAGEPLMWLLLIGTFGFGAPVPPTLQIFLLFLAAICAISADQRKSASRVAKRLAPLGVLTYSMYLIHPVVDIAGISLLGKKVLGLTGTANNLAIIGAIPFTMLLSYFSFMFFEDPARRWLAKMRSQRGTATSQADVRTPL